jgi:apolipoprotein N-acyltransferase
LPIRASASLVLGALLPFAFAPYAVWPLAILIPALLLSLLQSSHSLRNIFLVGLAFGLGYFGFGVYWIYNSLHDFGMAPPVVASGITGLLVIVLALFPALMLPSGSSAGSGSVKSACGCCRCSGSAWSGSRDGLPPACRG